MIQEEKAAAEYLAAHVYPTLEPVVLRLMCSLFFPQRFVSFLSTSESALLSPIVLSHFM